MGAEHRHGGRRANRAGQAMSAAAVALLAGCSSPPGAAPIADAPAATDPLGEIDW